MKKSKNRGATVIVIDAGGRGAVLAEAYAKSPYVKKIIMIPGNDLVKTLSSTKTILLRKHLKTTSVDDIVTIAVAESKKAPVLVDVAQDNAVEKGLVNRLLEKNIPVMGPTREAGQIEWSKDFARELGERCKIPQPIYKVFTSVEAGIKFLSKQKNQQWYVKASGLAEGKGALYAANNKEAMERIHELRSFGAAGKTYLLEEMLEGEEISVFAVSDGSRVRILGAAQDHKKSHNHDLGKNTGGMGCVSPPSIWTPKLETVVRRVIFEPIIAGLKREGKEYRGILYWGGMLVRKNGKIKLYTIEFNARWGDPESQVIVPGLQTDFYLLGVAVSQGNISPIAIKRDGRTRVGVVAASHGYPEDYVAVKGKQIYGLDRLQKHRGVKMYPAGIAKEGTKLVASGGRLFIVVGEGKEIVEAREKAYAALSPVFIEGNNLHYRTDIGYKDLERSYIKQR